MNLKAYFSREALTNKLKMVGTSALEQGLGAAVSYALEELGLPSVSDLHIQQLPDSLSTGAKCC